MLVSSDSRNERYGFCELALISDETKYEFGFRGGDELVIGLKLKLPGPLFQRNAIGKLDFDPPEK